MLFSIAVIAIFSLNQLAVEAWTDWNSLIEECMDYRGVTDPNFAETIGHVGYKRGTKESQALACICVSYTLTEQNTLKCTEGFEEFISISTKECNKRKPAIEKCMKTDSSLNDEELCDRLHRCSKLNN